MIPSNPFAAINLHGDGNIRGVTLALPLDRVRDFLPAGLELGPQDVTPAGTHPVVLFFQDLFHAHMSVPMLLPNMTYHEHTFGIPFTYLSRDSITPGYPGPYYYMPKLYLDDFQATLGGRLVWGLAKEMASFQVTADRCTITSLAGQRMTSLTWKPIEGPDAAYRPLADFPHFEPVRQMMNQPLINMVPAAIGPFFLLADFDKNWEVASIRPMQTAVEVDVDYVTGYAVGRYPQAGWFPGIDQSVLGSFELRAPWRLSLPYPALFSFRGR